METSLVTVYGIIPEKNAKKQNLNMCIRWDIIIIHNSMISYLSTNEIIISTILNNSVFYSFFGETSPLATQTRSFLIEQCCSGGQGCVWPLMDRRCGGQRADAISVSAETGTATQLGGTVMVSVSWGSEGEVDTSGPCLCRLCQPAEAR